MSATTTRTPSAIPSGRAAEKPEEPKLPDPGKDERQGGIDFNAPTTTASEPGQSVAKIPSLAGFTQERDAFTPEDVALPFLTILQDLSPQRKSSKPEYIPEARSGEILNTVTQERFKEVRVIPVRYQRRYVEWKPRSAGGGMVRDWGSDHSGYDAAQDTDLGVRLTRSGNEISANATYYVLHQTSRHWRPAIITMASTQWKKARRWNAVLDEYEIPDGNGHYVRAPIFARAFTVKSALESNASGEWYGWIITPDQDITSFSDANELIQRAVAFRSAVAAGTVQVAPPPGEDDIPF